MFAARNLTRLIDGQPIWSGLSLKLDAGERVALRGPSGSGKTLLMRSLVGLDALDEGDIRYKDRSIEEWNIPEYRRLVRYIPQDAAFVSGTVRQSIDLFFTFRVNRELSLDAVLLDSFLHTLQLPESFMDKTADHLSGGEKQVVAILRSLLLRPDVLLLDEPTSNLDEAMVSRVEKLVDVWMDDDPSRCFLWTSHDTRQLDRMTNKSITLTPVSVTGKHWVITSPVDSNNP